MSPSWLWWICIFCFVAESRTLVCESYDHKCKTFHSASSENSTCSSLQQCDETWAGSTLACYALLAQNKEGGVTVLKKGCTYQIGKECTQSSACNGQRKHRRKLQPLYYCCCTEDNCNRNVIMFLKEEKDKIHTMDDIKKAIMNLKWLIWAHLVTITIIIFLTAIVILGLMIILNKRRRKTARQGRHSYPLRVCDKGSRHCRNSSQWKKHDFQLITCLVRSSFGEIWQARLHGSNRVVRIRLTAGSDDVFVYDKHVLFKKANVHKTRVV
ncbi:uncharacterized protein LOC111331341 [Stylophora pistillata]|uniref:Uncharacterized protein n=1 Tax=Stylophora pistillata TaxID=50429 RepID=A0A2B4SVM3_STYPI|nr:uncharacterized protein LOC111331341 [Stylophora pistillata]XP_022792187.1 uncharacterized protein LOC111331341 [Stylophora pistillata]XP_022792194.1 uncharacterized protein LOC111331341 [Stylophora pistillata]PFX33931.1 hypothetical protein AWC38_SpisGene1115 [Stylophora pistillata]